MPSHEAQTALAQLVADYCATCRNPALPPFTVHAVQPWKGWWRSTQSYRPGCYVIYSTDGAAMYVGKASLNASMGSRIGTHEKDPRAKWDGAAFVQMVEVGEAFEAPSLEEYLLTRLPTRLNRVGVRVSRMEVDNASEANPSQNDSPVNHIVSY